MTKNVGNIMSVLASSAKKQAGLSLIEVIIALGLSAFLLLGIVTVFDSNKQSSNYQNAFSRVQESGRVAIDLLSRDIRMADYWGCEPKSTDSKYAKSVNSLIDFSSAPAHMQALENAFLAKIGLQVVNGSGSTDTVGGVSVKENTDRITVMGSKPLYGGAVRQKMPSHSAIVHIHKGADISSGELVLISDCSSADLFTNTTGNTQTSGEVGHNAGGSVGYPNVDKNLSNEYGLDAQIIKPYSQTYFVGRQSADDPWSLWRFPLTGVPEELVRNVADLQLIYGEDNDGVFDGNASVFVDGDNITDPEAVVSVRIAMSIESPEPLSDGTFLTKEFTATANIRNRTR